MTITERMGEDEPMAAGCGRRLLLDRRLGECATSFTPRTAAAQLG